MELDSILPKNKEIKTSKNRVFIKNIAWKPFIEIMSDNLLYIYLDGSLINDIIKITNKLQKSDYEFYFIPSKMSDPGLRLTDEEYFSDVIKGYLKYYSLINFYTGFNKIDFDFISNMVKFCEKENCNYLIKDIYDEVNRDVQKTFYDYYTNRYKFEVESEDIREEFKTLYRQIQLNRIIDVDT
jgi:hypothetical protein